MLRPFFLMKFRALILVLGIFFASCIRERIQDILFIRDDLVILIMDISACITGKKKHIDNNANIIGEIPCERNFSKAHKLFHTVKKRLEDYPKITKYPISETLLQEIREMLKDVRKDINSLSNGAEKTQFIEECTQLYNCISFNS